MTCKHGESNIYCAQCDRNLIDWYEKAPAYAVKSYESIAREAGFVVVSSEYNVGMWYWAKRPGERHKHGAYVDSEQEAWKACCVENGLL